MSRISKLLFAISVLGVLAVAPYISDAQYFGNINSNYFFLKSGAITPTVGSRDLNWDSGTFFIDASADSVGIRTSTPRDTLDINNVSGETVFLVKDIDPTVDTKVNRIALLDADNGTNTPSLANAIAIQEDYMGTTGRQTVAVILNMLGSSTGISQAGNYNTRVSSAVTGTVKGAVIRVSMKDADADLSKVISGHFRLLYDNAIAPNVDTAHIFESELSVRDGTLGTGIHYYAPATKVDVGSGTVTTTASFWADNQTVADTNYGIVLNGDGAGSDLVLGGGQDAKIYYDSTDLVLSPREVGSGAVTLGVGAADIDYQLKFDGETNDGIFTYMEDEDRLDWDGNLKIDGDTFWTGDGSGIPYGNMWNHDVGTTVDIIAINTPTQIPSGFTVGQVNLVTFQTARELVVAKAGRYEIAWNISFTTAAANQEIEGDIMVNASAVGSAKGGTAHRKITTATDTGNMSGSTILDLAANDVISLSVTNETSSTVDVDIEHANLVLSMVGGT